MICKHCGKETANVICDHCGINVVWYNKYGYQYDSGEIDVDNVSDYIAEDKHINDVENTLIDIFVPDGSGD